MSDKELIAQELKRDIAEKNIAKEVVKNKINIVLPFAERIWDFLKLINEDENFLFSNQAYPKDEDWAPLFRNNEYKKERAYHINKLKKNNGHRLRTRSFKYGSNGMNIIIGITDDFKPYGILNDNMTREQEKIFSADEFVKVLLSFFIKNKKK